MLTNMSKKQIEFMASDLARINILHGSIRSGKTVISLFKFALEVANYPDDAKFLMVGVTLDTLKRNCLDILDEILPVGVFQYSLGNKSGTLYGHTVYLEGANDSQSMRKIRGMTLTGAYLDEASLHNQDFVRTINGRLSTKGAFLIATTNPEEPTHWFKTDYIDAIGIDKKVWHFTLEDNVFLDADYIKNIKAEYRNMGNAYYQRYILGQWVRAEGVVYPQFCDRTQDYIVDKINENDIAFIQIGVDFGGNKSATSFTATAMLTNGRGVCVLESKRIDSTNLNPEFLGKQFTDFFYSLYENYPTSTIRYVFCDSAEQVLIRGLKMLGLPVTIRDSLKNEINSRIRLVNGLIAKRKFFVQARCTPTIDAMLSAVWKDKNSGKDERLDDGSTDIDSLDSMEYSIENETKYLVTL